MLESTKRAAGAAQDAANDCRTAAEEAKREADELSVFASEAASQAVQVQERVKILEAKLTAAAA